MTGQVDMVVFHPDFIAMFLEPGIFHWFPGQIVGFESKQKCGCGYA